MNCLAFTATSIMPLRRRPLVRGAKGGRVTDSSATLTAAPFS